MKIRNNHTPFRLRKATSAIGITLLAAWTLLAWPPAPTRADVIDDYEHGRKFLVQGNAGPPDWQFDYGQFRASLPAKDSFGVFAYKSLYELAEGQSLEFRLDLVAVNATDIFVGLVVHFGGYLWPKTMIGGYGFFVFAERVALDKQWTDSRTIFFDQNIPRKLDPKTIKLTFTRVGSDIRVGTKVVLRDDPGTVIFSKEVTDRSGIDVAGDNGPPPSGPAVSVFWEFGRMNSVPGAEVVVDNLVCSKDQEPVRLGLQRDHTAQATLVWPGWHFALESESVHGPWRPCPEPVTLGAGHFTSTVRCTDSARYFRLLQGVNVFDSFDKDTGWKTASVVPGSTMRPAVYRNFAQGRVRMLGTGTNNQDFVFRWNGDVGLWYRDCVATVDVSDWGEAMDDATFGILLRAVPAGEVWFNISGGLPDQRYAGLLTFTKADNPAESALSITGPGGAVLKEQRFAAVNPDKQYRLRFWAVGDQLTLELFDLADPGTPIQTVTVTDGRVPEGMDGLYGTRSAGGTYEVWIDQFMLTGATVY